MWTVVQFLIVAYIGFKAYVFAKCLYNGSNVQDSFNEARTKNPFNNGSSPSPKKKSKPVREEREEPREQVETVIDTQLDSYKFGKYVTNPRKNVTVGKKSPTRAVPELEKLKGLMEEIKNTNVLDVSMAIYVSYYKGIYYHKYVIYGGPDEDSMDAVNKLVDYITTSY